GYLELADRVGSLPAWRVAQFREKPDPAMAQRFFDAGPARYLWNSGMFVWSAQTFLRALDAFCGDDADTLRRLGTAHGGRGFDELAGREWQGLTKRSVDYAVMEPASGSTSFRVLAVPLTSRWQERETT